MNLELDHERKLDSGTDHRFAAEPGRGSCRDRPTHKAAEEGGCGVVGLAASVPVAGRHLIAPARQMHNRGNGKGGGMAASGLSPQQMGVSAETLRDATLLQVAYLDAGARPEVERRPSSPTLTCCKAIAIPTVDDYREVPGLEVRPPDVVRYFVRAKAGCAGSLCRGKRPGGAGRPRRSKTNLSTAAAFSCNQRFYASLGEQRAFVLSHGRDLVVFKIVGYAEQAAAYYQLEDLLAHVWVAHQRYPTKGRVWHPGGAHPFIGLNEALVHNGDFANYHALSAYLRQRNIVPLFLTDTEVSVLLFDLMDRVYGYPLEATIEALAPTTERDLLMLPAEKQQLYRAVQATHLHASPDGPWFFIIARSHPDAGQWQLLGITDTSMLRPQVFALQEGKVQIGLVASEKQAIDATLESLAAEDERICPVADRYWSARGGSHTDGGAFVFTVSQSAGQQEWERTRERAGGDRQVRQPDSDAAATRSTTIRVRPGWQRRNWSGCRPNRYPGSRERRPDPGPSWIVAGAEGVETAWMHLAREVQAWDYGELTWFNQRMAALAAEGPDAWRFAVGVLTRLRDRQYDPGSKRRASVLALVDRTLGSIFDAVPSLDAAGIPPEGDSQQRRVDWAGRAGLRGPA